MLLADAGSLHTERFFEETKNQGCDTVLVSLETGIKESTTLQRKGPLRQLHYRFAVPEIKDIIQKFQPDIISAHFASGYGHIAALANKSEKVPLALNLWGSDILIVPKKSFLHKQKTKLALENADYVFADSQYLIDAAKKIYPFTNYAVFPWGVEKELLNLKYNIANHTTPLKIIVPRAHETVYNNLFIVESLKEFINHDKILLTFPAFGSLYETFKTECRKLVGDKIHFYTKADRDDFMKLVSEHDYYLSASLSDSSPVSLIESMAIGLVPIVHKIDGVREWISEANGFLFENNPESLQKVITSLLESSDDFSGIIEKNKKRVQETALFEKNISDQLTTFQSMVDAKI